MPHGALRWAAEHDKQGLLFITPISAETRAELDRYIRQHPRMGNVPLFPAPGPRREKGAPPPSGLEKPVSRETAARWLLRAGKAAGPPKLTGGVFHPYRRLFASERRHLPDLDVATAAGWKNPGTMRRACQHTDPAAVPGAVNHGSSARALPGEHAGGVDLVEESVATEVPKDASLEERLHMADMLGRQLGGLEKLDLAAGFAENAVEDDEVIVRVDVERRAEAVKEADGSELGARRRS